MIVVLLLILGTAAGVGVVAYGMGRAGATERNRLNKMERDQFRNAEALIDDLYGDAVTADTLGESFGAIAREKIQSYNRKANQ